MSSCHSKRARYLKRHGSASYRPRCAHLARDQHETPLGPTTCASASRVSSRPHRRDLWSRSLRQVRRNARVHVVPPPTLAERRGHADSSDASVTNSRKRRCHEHVSAVAPLRLSVAACRLRRRTRKVGPALHRRMNYVRFRTPAGSTRSGRRGDVQGYPRYRRCPLQICGPPAAIASVRLPKRRRRLDICFRSVPHRIDLVPIRIVISLRGRSEDGALRNARARRTFCHLMTPVTDSKKSHQNGIIFSA